MQLKDRVDDLRKRVRGLEQMEKRLAQLEKRLAKIEGAARRSRRRRAQEDDREEADASREARATRTGVRHPTLSGLRGMSTKNASRTGVWTSVTSARARAGRPARSRRSRASCPTCSPSSSMGSGSAASTSTRLGAHDLDLRVPDVPALVELRRRRQEVELADVADQHDVELAVVRSASGASFMPPPCHTPLATITSCIAPAALAAVERHGDVGVLPLEEDPRQRIEEGRLAAECLRHPVRALRDGAAHPDRADVREHRSAPRRPGAVADAAGVDRSRHAVQRDATASSKRVGMPYVRPKSRPVPSGARRTRSASGDAVHDLVQRPVAAHDDEQSARGRRPRAQAR